MGENKIPFFLLKCILDLTSDSGCLLSVVSNCARLFSVYYVLGTLHELLHLILTTTQSSPHFTYEPLGLGEVTK